MFDHNKLPNHDYQYLDLIEGIIDSGTPKGDRTGTGTLCTAGRSMKFDISGGKLPVLTTKKIILRSIIHELIWMISGSTNIRYLKDNKVSIWDSWLIPGTEERDEAGNLIAGDIGAGYGRQWRHWEDTRVVPASQVDSYTKRGFVMSGSLTEESLLTIAGGEPQVVVQRVIDQLKVVVETLKKNPDSRRIIVSAWNVSYLDEMALPPCFIPGALVATPDGYRAIETLMAGDIVYSGTGIPRAVNQVWKTPYNGEVIHIRPKYVGVPFACTPNHPFLVKDKGWVEAKDLAVDDYVAFPKTKSVGNHSFTYKIPHGSSGKELEHVVDCTLDDYYTFGYFLGNGWASRSKNRISFAIPHSKVDYILPKLRETIKISLKPGDALNVATYETRSEKWIGLFRTFGHKAHNKMIPEWVLNSSREAKEKFLEGFIDADGYEASDTAVSICVTSAGIVLGLQRILAELGYVAGTSFQIRPEKTFIEGREVNQRNTYSLRFNRGERNGSRAIIDDNYVWVPLMNITKLTTEQTHVYNLDVEEEHTYTVSNVVNHNCHAFFQFVTEPLIWTNENGETEYNYDECVGQARSNGSRDVDNMYNDYLSRLVDGKNTEARHADMVVEFKKFGVKSRKLSCILTQRKQHCALAA